MKHSCFQQIRRVVFFVYRMYLSSCLFKIQILTAPFCMWSTKPDTVWAWVGYPSADEKDQSAASDCACSLLLWTHFVNHVKTSTFLYFYCCMTFTNQDTKQIIIKGTIRYIVLHGSGRKTVIQASSEKLIQSVLPLFMTQLSVVLSVNSLFTSTMSSYNAPPSVQPGLPPANHKRYAAPP